MTFILRPYQEEMVNKTRQALRAHNAVLLQAPTGAGKTAIGANIIDGAVQKNNSCFFIVHRQELIEQSADAFTLQGIPFGIVAAGYNPNPFQPVQICSIGTLKNRLDRLPIRPRVILWDEAHHVAAGGWEKVFEYYPDANHIGLSATPERLDGQGLGKYFKKMVMGPSVAWLIENGYLSKYKIFGSENTPDLSSVNTRMGDYATSDLESVMDKPTITGDAISHYLQHARGKRFLAFASSRKHSEHVAEQFRAAGVMAVHVDGETDKNDRRLAMQGFRNGDIIGLINVDLFGEGVDVPAAECLIDLAPSKSLSKVMQRWGRVLRPAVGKEFAVILDHSGNWKRHGFPDDERIWSLDSKKRRKKKENDDEDIAVRQCVNCYHVHKRSPSCPACGFIYPVVSREIEFVEGQLFELNSKERAVINKQLLKKARTFPELLTLAIMWDIPNPELWAERILAERKQIQQHIIRRYRVDRSKRN